MSVTYPESVLFDQEVIPARIGESPWESMSEKLEHEAQLQAANLSFLEDTIMGTGPYAEGDQILKPLDRILECKDDPEMLRHFRSIYTLVVEHATDIDYLSKALNLQERLAKQAESKARLLRMNTVDPQVIATTVEAEITPASIEAPVEVTSQPLIETLTPSPPAPVPEADTVRQVGSKAMKVSEALAPFNVSNYAARVLKAIKDSKSSDSEVYDFYNQFIADTAASRSVDQVVGDLIDSIVRQPRRAIATAAAITMLGTVMPSHAHHASTARSEAAKTTQAHTAPKPPHVVTAIEASVTTKRFIATTKPIGRPASVTLSGTAAPILEHVAATGTMPDGLAVPTALVATETALGSLHNNDPSLPPITITSINTAPLTSAPDKNLLLHGVSVAPQQAPVDSMVLKVNSEQDVAPVFKVLASDHPDTLIANPIGLPVGSSLIEGNKNVAASDITLPSPDEIIVEFLSNDANVAGSLVTTETSTTLQSTPETSTSTTPSVAGTEAGPLGAPSLNAQQIEIIDALPSLSEADKSFLKTISAAVIADYHNGSKINPSVVIAQAIDESGWNGSTLSAKYFNPFGLKAGTTWTGPTVMIPTSEFGRDGYYTIMSAWQVFPNFMTAVASYATEIDSNPVFTDAAACDATPLEYLDGLEYQENANCVVIGGGPQYATDPTYVNKMLGLISDFHIDQIVDAATPHLATSPRLNATPKVSIPASTTSLPASPAPEPRVVTPLTTEQVASPTGVAPEMAGMPSPQVEARIRKAVAWTTNLSAYNVAELATADSSDPTNGCDFVRAIYAPLDPNFPVSSTTAEMSYLESTPSLWHAVSNNGNESDLMPGDVFVMNKNGAEHTFVYTGSVGVSINGTTAVSASLGGHVPETWALAGGLPISNGKYSQNGVDYSIFRFVGKPPTTATSSLSPSVPTATTTTTIAATTTTTVTSTDTVPGVNSMLSTAPANSPVTVKDQTLKPGKYELVH